MPKAVRKPSRAQSAWAVSNEGWETALVTARSGIRDFVWDKCANIEIRAQVHDRICTAVETYVRSLIRAKKRKAAGKESYRREFIDEPLGAVEPLRRLVTSNSTYAQARAWQELPAVAMDALSDAAFQLRRTTLSRLMRDWPTLPGTFVQFDAAEIAELLPVAIEIARSYGNRNSVRDRMVKELLAQFRTVYGRHPSEKEADRFLSAIQPCYSPLLPPYGFNIRSPSTVYRALNNAKAQGLG